MKSLTLASFALLSGLVLGRPDVLSRQESGGPAPLRIAVVDWNAVKNRSKKIGAMISEEEKKLAGLNRELEDLTKKVKDLEDGLVMFEKGSKEADQAVRDLKVARYKLEQTRTMGTLWARKHRNEILLRIYDIIHEKVRLLAEKKHLDLVLRLEQESKEEVKLGTAMRLSVRQANTCLYHSDRLDLTEEVIQLLDA